MKRLSHPGFIEALIIFLLAATMGLLQAGPTPMWKVSFEKEVKWQLLTPTGHLVVSTDKALYGLNPDNGDILWKDEELKKLKQEFFELVPFTHYAVISKGKGFLGAQNKTILFDYISGKPRWSSENLDLANSMGQFILPEINGLFLYGLNKKGKKRTYAVELETGNIIWENADFFKKRDPNMHKLTKMKQTIVGNQEPLFDTDETMITFMNKKALRKWNARTGQLIWETEIKAKYSPAVKYGFASMLLSDDGSVLYTPVGKSVLAVRTSDGSLPWGKKGPKLKGMVHQMQLTSQGLVVKGGPNLQGKDGKPFITVLNLSSGEKIWKKEFKKLKESTNFVVKDDRVIVYSDKKIFAIKLADGDYRELAKDLKFKDKQSPHSLRIRDNGYYLQSANNMMLVGFDGNPVYHVYHKAPGSSMFSKIASTAVLAAVNAASAMDGYARANANAYRSGGRGSARYSLITRNSVLSKRFQKTKSARNYTYVLTNIKTGGEKGPGLVKVNKTDGSTENRIVLGTKKPEYEIDEIEGRLFFRQDKKEIICYTF